MLDPRPEDARSFIIYCLRRPEQVRWASYGYDFYLPTLMLAYVQEVEGSTEHPSHIVNGPRSRQISPAFYEAAWELCRRGILRPGVNRQGEQATDNGSGGDGYSVTSSGRAWIASSGAIDVLMEQSRLAALFTNLSASFGPAFLQRALEAGNCHHYANYLACCAMSGAAAESILLAVAIQRSGDEAATLTMYRSASGRKRVTDSVIGNKPPHIAEPFRNATGLLSYWRDEAAHGAASTISEIEAHEALGRLIRFAQFSSENWAALTAHQS